MLIIPDSSLFFGPDARTSAAELRNLKPAKVNAIERGNTARNKLRILSKAICHYCCNEESGSSGLEALPRVTPSRPSMQPCSAAVRDGEDQTSRAELTAHEEAQEKLYLLWRSGMVQGAYIGAWARSLQRLAKEGECAYLLWLFRTHPPLATTHKNAA